MKFPKSAKRVFKGEIFEVYQWPQKMFDGSTKTFEFVKRQDTVIILATVGNKIVGLKQKQPHTGWFICTPSGRMDVPGESPMAAAKRELLEETGMIAEKFFLWKKVDYNNKVKNTIYFFIARNCKKLAEQKLDGGEKIKVFLMSFEEYLKLADNPSNHIAESVIDMFKARLDKKYKNYLKKAIFG